jgi:hypothetical protein
LFNLTVGPFSLLIRPLGADDPVTLFILTRHSKDKAGVFTLQAVLVSHYSSTFVLVSRSLLKISKTYHGYTHVDHRVGE